MSRHRGWIVAGLMLGGMLTPSVANGQVDASDPAMANMAGDPNQPDPPQRVARISVLNGTASFEPASVDEFSPAEINYPMTTGDRLYSAAGTTAEIQAGQIAVRLGETSDVTVTAMTDTLAQFGVAGGSVHLRTFGMDEGTTVELDTPNAAITVLQPGDIRVDVDPNTDLSYVTVISGQVQVDGTDFEQVINAGASLQLNGLSPLEVSQVGAPQLDGLDSFSGERDEQFTAAAQQDGQYVNDATVGAGDLATYGQWDQDADNGAVWYPSGVAVDWLPYRVGHWTWIAPWGWTWVEAEPWGFAPFHYGRWVVIRGRWGWVPGPRVVRPVWAPALVVFVGGDGFAAGLGYRGGVAAWFPLGPHEVYSPWYHSSPRYMNRVNVSNLYTRDTRNVRAVYNSRTVDPGFAGGSDTRQYAYRDRAVVVPQAAFAAGRSAAQNQVHVQPGQLANAVVLPHPTVTPAHEIVAPAPARAVPTHVARPVLDARSRAEAGSAEGGSVSSFHGTPIVRQVPPVLGAVNPPNMTRGQPPLQAQQPTRQGAVNQPNPTRGQPPVQMQPPVQGAVNPPAVPRQPPVQVQQPVMGHVDPPNVTRGQPPLQMQPPVRQGAVVEPRQPMQPPVQAQPAPSQEPRGLFNRVSPPQPRPSFEQQRQAIEETDPGRPLSPRQMDNVRQNQPAGPAQQREAAPHPALPPAARPEPEHKR